MQRMNSLGEIVEEAPLEEDKQTNIQKPDASISFSQFILPLPPIFKVGELSRETELERQLKNFKVPVEEYIWYTNLKRLGGKGKLVRCTFMLTLSLIHYQFSKEVRIIRAIKYSQIERLTFKTENKEISLHLFALKKNKTNKIKTFTCNTIDEQENIIHIIERQMKKDWQIEFEDKNVLSLPEEYVLHVFVKKITGLGKILDRCIVLSTNYVTSLGFKMRNNQMDISKISYRLPIGAITGVIFSLSKRTLFCLTFKMDKNKQNELLSAGGQKKSQKLKRKFETGDLQHARDILYGINRLHHILCGKFLDIQDLASSAAD